MDGEKAIVRYTAELSGVCAKKVHFVLFDNTIISCEFTGGCNGNLKAISKLVKGKPISEIRSTLEGITCGSKSTSCADQFAKILAQILGV